MISLEGYKAFRGIMRIIPKNPNIKPFDLAADWLYKPEHQCWYGGGGSFMEEICTVLVDLTEAISVKGGRMRILTGPGDSTIEIVRPAEGNPDDHLAECPFCGGTDIFTKNTNTRPEKDGVVGALPALPASTLDTHRTGP